MPDHRSQYFGALAILVGTAVGAGIFGIPYVMAQAGFFVGLGYLLFLGGAIILTVLCYGEVVLRTYGTHQFTGYAQKYLGRKGKIIALVSLIFGLYGAMIAYLIEVPKFLLSLLHPWAGENLLVYRLAYFALAALAIYFGLGIIVRLEKVMIVLLLMVMALFIFFGFKEINVDYYQTYNWANFFLPYGVILFALGAATAVPDMKNILTHQRHKMRSAIIIGLLIPIAIYALFALVVVGVTGPATTESAIVGLGDKLGEFILLVGAIFGTLSMTTSFLALAIVLKEVYQYDFLLNKKLAWALVVFPPLIMVLLNLIDFIQVLGIVGAVISGFEGTLIMVLFWIAKKKGERKPEYEMKIPLFLVGAVILIFLLGMVYQIYNLIA